MRYPGGKGGDGVYQKIINLIPPHHTYIEAFVGGGNIFERKRPAARNILIDADADIASLWTARAAAASTTVIHGDAAPFLQGYDWQGGEFVYCDPPYVMGARRGGKIYRHEFTDQQHRDLVSSLLALPDGVNVMLSGYRHPIYDEALTGWRTVDFQAMTRRGVATETLWMNYQPPAVLHDFSYVGENFRERERVKRKRLRWRARLERMEEWERAALLSELLEILPPEMAMLEHR